MLRSILYKLNLAFIGLILICRPPIFAQSNNDFSWWNAKHNWDGYTHWTDYMTYSPGYFGPNALPIPSLPQGVLPNQIEVESQIKQQVQKGERTLDGSYRLFWPFSNGRVGVEVLHIYAERYMTDTILRDERAARFRNVEGFATGDLNFSTYISLLQNSQWPDILLRVNLRIASGSDIENARYTDLPGYHFDLSFGKNIFNTDHWNIRSYGMGGLYVWQITRNIQNDAILWGIGTSISYKNYGVQFEASGYHGYLNIGDRPAQLRLTGDFAINKFEYKFCITKGIKDIHYYTFALGVQYSFNPLKRTNE